MGAGVSNLGYDQGFGCHVLNGTTTRLLKGELVAWDASAPASTDKALRVKRLVLDGDAYAAGVLLTDCPASGGYAPMIHTGRVHARVASDVTAGGLIVPDRIDASAGIIEHGQLKLKSSTGAGFLACMGVAITAAVAEGGTQYWADVELAGLNTGAAQELLRGGGFSLNTTGVQSAGIAAGTVTKLLGYGRAPVGGSIAAIVVMSTIAVPASNTNFWNFTISRAVGPAIIVTRATTVTGGALTANVFSSSAGAAVVTAGETLRFDMTVGGGTPTDLSGGFVMIFAEYDSGIGGIVGLFGR